MMHDFAVTKEHVIFPVLPTTADLARIKGGGAHWCGTNEGDVRGHHAARGQREDIRWFRGPPTSPITS